MREYFAAPSRFFSLELHGVRDFLRQCERVHEFEILFALEQRPLTLIGRVNARDFHLFATPVINLYRRHCSPVLLTGERTEHQLVVDRLNTSLYEIHSVKQVKGMLPDGNPVIFSSLQADVHYDCGSRPAIRCTAAGNRRHPNTTTRTCPTKILYRHLAGQKRHRHR